MKTKNGKFKFKFSEILNIENEEKIVPNVIILDTDFLDDTAFLYAIMADYLAEDSPDFTSLDNYWSDSGLVLYKDMSGTTQDYSIDHLLQDNLEMNHFNHGKMLLRHRDDMQTLILLDKCRGAPSLLINGIFSTGFKNLRLFISCGKRNVKKMEIKLKSRPITLMTLDIF